MKDITNYLNQAAQDLKSAFGNEFDLALALEAIAEPLEEMGEMYSYFGDYDVTRSGNRITIIDADGNEIKTYTVPDNIPFTVEQIATAWNQATEYVSSFDQPPKWEDVMAYVDESFPGMGTWISSNITAMMSRDLGIMMEDGKATVHEVINEYITKAHDAVQPLLEKISRLVDEKSIIAALWNAIFNPAKCIESLADLSGNVQYYNTPISYGTYLFGLMEDATVWPIYKGVFNGVKWLFNFAKKVALKWEAIIESLLDVNTYVAKQTRLGVFEGLISEVPFNVTFVDHDTMEAVITDLSNFSNISSSVLADRIGNMRACLRLPGEYVVCAYDDDLDGLLIYQFAYVQNSKIPQSSIFERAGFAYYPYTLVGSVTTVGGVNVMDFPYFNRLNTIFQDQDVETNKVDQLSTENLCAIFDVNQSTMAILHYIGLQMMGVNWIVPLLVENGVPSRFSENSEQYTSVLNVGGFIDISNDVHVVADYTLPTVIPGMTSSDCMDARIYASRIFDPSLSHTFTDSEINYLIYGYGVSAPLNGKYYTNVTEQSGSTMAEKISRSWVLALMALICCDGNIFTVNSSFSNDTWIAEFANQYTRVESITKFAMRKRFRLVNINAIFDTANTVLEVAGATLAAIAIYNKLTNTIGKAKPRSKSVIGTTLGTFWSNAYNRLRIRSMVDNALGNDVNHILNDISKVRKDIRG